MEQIEQHIINKLAIAKVQLEVTLIETQYHLEQANLRIKELEENLKSFGKKEEENE